ncbi:MAG: hypothetical protein V1889_03875 [archaeon]
MNHAMMIGAKAYKVFWGIIFFIGVYMVYVDDFVKVANSTLFRNFPKSFKVYIIFFALIICFVFIEVKNVVIAASAKIFGMDVDFPFTSSAYCKFWLPFDFFITSVAKPLGVMFFFLIAIDAFFYHVKK